MNLMNTMEHTLQTGLHTGPAKVKPREGLRKMQWPAEFLRPIEAALHLGTPQLPETRSKHHPAFTVEFILD